MPRTDGDRGGVGDGPLTADERRVLPGYGADASVSTKLSLAADVIRRYDGIHGGHDGTTESTRYGRKCRTRTTVCSVALFLLCFAAAVPALFPTRGRCARCLGRLSGGGADQSCAARNGAALSARAEKRPRRRDRARQPHREFPAVSADGGNASAAVPVHAADVAIRALANAAAARGRVRTAHSAVRKLRHR